ncbi:hypothetical protein CDD83_18 [Cordyceps sp. RAO-2017]|nr:hypothetical protein CDD83_18 [Cordyceps sp. RAO-2017]
MKDIASPEIPFYSAVTGRRLTKDMDLGPAYWRKNLENPVLFNTAFRSALSGEDRRLVLIEIGAHPALKAPVIQILRDLGRNEDVHVGTLHRGEGCDESLLHLAGKLFQQGQGTASLAGPRQADEWRFREHAPHELLGSRAFEVSHEPIWRNKLSLTHVPWLSGHRIDGQILLPGTAYVAMVGEAIRQLHGARAYKMRNVEFAAGLEIAHDKEVEVVTSMATGNADDMESSWCAFRINAFDGERWVKHCTGEARLSSDDSEDPPPAHKPPALARTVDEADWYRVLRRAGYNYTDRFQGLRNISSAPEKDEATATIPVQDAADYAIHPVVMDQCIQLFTVAACRGLGRRLRSVSVPTFIREVTVRHAAANEDLSATASIGPSEGSSLVGDLTARIGRETIFSVEGLKMVTIARAETAEESLPLISQIEWRPHADFIDFDALKYVPPCLDRQKYVSLAELVTLCMIDHREKLQVADEAPPHLSNYLAWMEEFVRHYESGSNAFLADCPRLCDMTRTERLARMEAIVADGETSPFAVAFTAIWRMYNAAEAIFAGSTHPLHVLQQDNLNSAVYGLVLDMQSATNADDMILIIAHTNPRLRILEVGAGTGASSERLLEKLHSSYGERLYGSYTFTDISTGFMREARERLARFDSVDYQVLDISKDPTEQGFRQQEYDLIVAHNVLRATPYLRETLGHLKGLLRPEGRLYLLELCQEMKYINYIYGFLEGWWLGAEDGRADEPYITPERWSEELVAAGFLKPDVSIPDCVAPYQTCASILASADTRTSKPSRVGLLCYGPRGPYVEEVRESLASLGIAVDTCILGQPLPGQDVISLLELEKPLVDDLCEESFRSLIGHMRELDGRLIWATRPSQVGCQDPRYSLILGLARSARKEFSVKLYTVEIDDSSSASAAGALARILLHVRRPERVSDSMQPDWEYGVVNDEVLIPRFHGQTISDALSQPEEDRPGRPPTMQRLTLDTPGLLQNMRWSEVEREIPGHGQALLRMEAVGLNFRVSACHSPRLPFSNGSLTIER